MVNSTVYNFIIQHKLIKPGSTVIVGFSGGPDSVFLLHQLAQLQQELDISLIATHLNHGWRNEADRDVIFCKSMAEQLDIPFVSAHASEFSEISNNGSKEDYGRRLRRAFFERIAQNYPACQIALAHHSDDQIETFFIRLIRGAGLEGLQGIKRCHGNYIRPLLCISKSDILAYLHAQNIPYLIDHTNSQSDYLRNRIRQSAIPALHSCDERFSSSVLRTINNITEAEDYVQKITAEIFASITKQHQGKLWIILEQFFELHPFLQKRILLHWLCFMRVPFTPSQGLFAEILRFLQSSQGGGHTLYQSWKIVKWQSLASIILKDERRHS